MPRLTSLFIALFLSISLLFPATTLARQPKKYQVTGMVLEVTADFIAVDKDGERWEIGRGANTKVNGTLKTGEKVTIEYQMTASRVDVKQGKSSAK